MYALSLASQRPSALVDWNNNYGGDEDKCVLFHCGNWPKAFRDMDGEFLESMWRSNALAGFFFAKAALDVAIHDVVGKIYNVPVYQLLGGLVRREIPIAHSIGLMNTEDALRESIEVSEQACHEVLG
jgi:L-alanine-DL-glutamate epimerase-like enolase superfamily enzyme